MKNAVYLGKRRHMGETFTFWKKTFHYDISGKKYEKDDILVEREENCLGYVDTIYLDSCTGLAEPTWRGLPLYVKKALGKQMQALAAKNGINGEKRYY